MVRQVIHPRLFGELQNFYTDVCTIESSVEVQDTAGHPVPTWSTFPGHANLACRRAPLSNEERKATNQIYTIATHTINLAGSYSTITPKMRAVISGQAYDILSVDLDGYNHSTRLTARIVT